MKVMMTKTIVGAIDDKTSDPGPDTDARELEIEAMLFKSSNVNISKRFKISKKHGKKVGESPRSYNNSQTSRNSRW